MYLCTYVLVLCLCTYVHMYIYIVHVRVNTVYDEFVVSATTLLYVWGEPLSCRILTNCHPHRVHTTNSTYKYYVPRTRYLVLYTACMYTGTMYASVLLYM